MEGAKKWTLTTLGVGFGALIVSHLIFAAVTRVKRVKDKEDGEEAADGAMRGVREEQKE